MTKNKESCFIWPFLKVPTLPKWYSGTGRVILCGDGAHGLPPSSGQGINQCLEDVYSLTLLLKSVGSIGKRENSAEQPRVELLEALEYWQDMRQSRVDAVFDWATNSTNVQRMSEEERKKLLSDGKIKENGAAQGDDMSWLYRPSLENDVKAWIASHS